MKILVTLKRVEDQEVKIRIKPDGSGIETQGMKYEVNPFDKIAVEEALRLRTMHGGEIVVVSIGQKETAQQLRAAFAIGADRGLLVLADKPVDPLTVASVLEKLVREEKPDLVILGKQAVDDDLGQIGPMLAEKLGWGQASFASKVESLESPAEKSKVPALKVENGRVEVVREVDGGVETVSVVLPAVVTTDLRLNVPRFASLPGIKKAQTKEIRELPLSAFGVDGEPRLRIVQLEPPKQRKAGIRVPDVATLVDKLHQEAKVI